MHYYPRKEISSGISLYLSNGCFGMSFFLLVSLLSCRRITVDISIKINALSSLSYCVSAIFEFNTTCVLITTSALTL